jgi:hypothetical protein
MSTSAAAPSPASLGSKVWDGVRYTYSTAIVVFSLAVICKGIVDKQMNIYDVFGEDMPSPVAFLITIVLIVWLGFLEGAQAGIVGLHGVPKSEYEATHPIALRTTTLCHRGGNLESFIVGRQFLVVFVVFIISNTLTFQADLEELPFGLPAWVGEAFLESGLMGAVVTIVFGQLISQLVASKCNVDYLNSHVCYVTAIIALAIEYSGLMHFVYVLQWVAIKLSGTTPEGGRKSSSSADGMDLSDMDPSTGAPLLENGEGGTVVVSASGDAQPDSFATKAFWVARCVLSALLLGFALAVVVDSLFEERTNLWESVPSWAGFLIFLVLLVMAGTLEGLQIALFTCQKMDREVFKTSHPRAYNNLSHVFNGDNLNAFLIGRQIFITLLMFVLGQVTTISAGEDGDATVFGLPVGLQEGIMETGLLGAIITTILGSLTARCIATAFPLGFCNAPAMGLVIRVCLSFEFVGVTHVAWPLSAAYKASSGMQADDTYLKSGTKA